MRVRLDGLAPSVPSSGLGGLPLSPRDFQEFRQHGPQMRVAPSGGVVVLALLHVAARRLNWVFPVNACGSDSLATSVFAVPVAPLPTFADGTDLGQHAVSSELSTTLHDDNAPHPSSVATPASSTDVLDKAALRAIAPALPVQRLSCAPIQIVRRPPLLRLIQPRVSPGRTVHKLRSGPRLCLCCLHLLRRPCRLFFRRGSFSLGPAVTEPPLLASLRPPSITDFSRALHRPSSYCADPTRHRCGHTCFVFA